MTARIAALTVILEGTPRDDDVEQLISAIQQLRGVADVVTIEHTGDIVIAEMRARNELRKKVLDALRDIFG